MLLRTVTPPGPSAAPECSSRVQPPITTAGVGCATKEMIKPCLLYLHAERQCPCGTCPPPSTRPGGRRSPGPKKRPCFRRRKHKGKAVGNEAQKRLIAAEETCNPVYSTCMPSLQLRRGLRTWPPPPIIRAAMPALLAPSPQLCTKETINPVYTGVYSTCMPSLQLRTCAGGRWPGPCRPPAWSALRVGSSTAAPCARRDDQRAGRLSAMLFRTVTPPGPSAAHQAGNTAHEEPSKPCLLHLHHLFRYAGCTT